MSDRVDVVGTGSAQVQPDVMQVQVGAEGTADDVASRVQGIRLAASEPGAGLDSAREAAVADARHQAGELARLAGRELGGVRRITTSTARSHGGQVQMEWMEQSGRQSGLPIEAGFSTVTVSVHVRFDLV